MALDYMPQLDGLRAVAVMAVLIHHYTDDHWPTGATWGVRLFFVLSGFLITGILLRARDAKLAEGMKPSGALFRFYVRRALRIFPLYYLVIAVAVVADADSVREFSPWLATYTLNLKMAEQGWFINHFAHFWTLAVEEQFYVFWPWFVLLVPHRKLLWVASAMLVVGPLYRLYCVLGWAFFDSESSGLVAHISTFACLDTLGMGAVLAILVHNSKSPTSLRRMLTVVALPSGLVMYGWLYVLASRYDSWEVGLVFSDLCLALAFAWLIHSASLGFRGPVGALLQLQPLTYVGKISYGIYVYHAFIPAVLLFLFTAAGWQYPQTMWVEFPMATLVTVAVASASWYLLESPINGFKRHFTLNAAHADGPVSLGQQEIVGNPVVQHEAAQLRNA